MKYKNISEVVLKINGRIIRPEQETEYFDPSPAIQDVVDRKFLQTV
jgi:hypothetical protein